MGGGGWGGLGPRPRLRSRAAPPARCAGGAGRPRCRAAQAARGDRAAVCFRALLVDALSPRVHTSCPSGHGLCGVFRVRSGASCPFGGCGSRDGVWRSAVGVGSSVSRTSESVQAARCVDPGLRLAALAALTALAAPCSPRATALGSLPRTRRECTRAARVVTVCAVFSVSVRALRVRSAVVGPRGGVWRSAAASGRGRFSPRPPQGADGPPPSTSPCSSSQARAVRLRALSNHESMTNSRSRSGSTWGSRSSTAA